MELATKAPRTPNFNMLASDHHPLLSTAPALDDAGIEALDKIFRDRWGALWSIDDMVGRGDRRGSSSSRLKWGK